jgi:hypothetical protein
MTIEWLEHWLIEYAEYLKENGSDEYHRVAATIRLFIDYLERTGASPWRKVGEGSFSELPKDDPFAVLDGYWMPLPPLPKEHGDDN